MPNPDSKGNADDEKNVSTEGAECRLERLSRSVCSSPLDVTREILRKEGVQGLFRGLTSTLVRECPGYGCFFGGYELTRSLLINENQKKADIGTAPCACFAILCSFIPHRFHQDMDIRWYGGHLLLANHVSYRRRQITHSSFQTRSLFPCLRRPNHTKRR